MKEIKVYSKNRRSLVCIIVFAGLSVLSLALIMGISNAINVRYNTNFMSICLISVFMVSFSFGASRYFCKHLTIVINTKGIYLQCLPHMKEYIPWTSVTGFEEIDIIGRKKLSILTDTTMLPSPYLSSPQCKLLKKQNIRMFGSPYVIPTHLLSINHESLKSILVDYYTQHQKAI